MFGFLAGKTVLKLLPYIAIVTIIIGAVGYHYYKLNSVQSDLTKAEQTIGVLRIDLATSQANEEKLTSAVMDQNESIQLLEQQRQSDQAKINKLSKEYNLSRKHVDNLRKLLSKHDLAYLSSRKPGLIEPRINKGTSNVGKKIEELTLDTANE